MIRINSGLGLGEKLTDKPLITIITVSYNCEVEIERTIKNVLNQTYENIEYIIVDGASTDNTVNIIKKYENKITYWISEKDEGIYHAMNKAIDFANGILINFMNAGDTFVDEHIVENLVKQLRPEHDIYYGSRFIHREDSVEFEETGAIDEFFIRMPFGHQAAFAKTELLKKYHFDRSYRLSADYDFFMKCYKNDCTFHNLGFPICNFTFDGLSFNQQFKSLVETLKVLSDYVGEKEVKRSTFYKHFAYRHLKEEHRKKNEHVDREKVELRRWLEQEKKDKVELRRWLEQEKKDKVELRRWLDQAKKNKVELRRWLDQEKKDKEELRRWLEQEKKDKVELRRWLEKEKLKNKYSPKINKILNIFLKIKNIFQVNK